MTDTKKNIEKFEDMEDIPDKSFEQQLVSLLIPDIKKSTYVDTNRYEVPKEHVARVLGYWIIAGFIISVILVLVPYTFNLFFYKELNASNINELLKTIVTVFGTPLGFVFGYYYTQKIK